MTNLDASRMMAATTTTSTTISRAGRRKHAVPEGPVVFPQDVVERIERVARYHNASKHNYHSVREARPALDWANHPSPYCEFLDKGLPVLKLPHDLLDASAPALALLADGVGAVGKGVEHP